HTPTLRTHHHSFPTRRSSDLDRIRDKARLHQRRGAGPLEAAAAVADIKDHAAFAAVDHRLARSPGFRILLATAASVHVSQNIPWTKILVQQIVERSSGANVAAEVYHHGNVRNASGLLRLFVRRPFGAGEVRALDSDNQ